MCVFIEVSASHQIWWPRYSEVEATEMCNIFDNTLTTSVLSAKYCSCTVTLRPVRFSILGQQMIDATDTT